MRNRAAVLIAGAVVACAMWGQTGQMPFVGCAQDGQAGPLEAPKGSDKALQVAIGAAKHLAFYSTNDGFGVLAPRNWHCFGTYGSSGGSLFISPEPLGYADLFPPNWGGMEGPAIEIEATEGGGSGTAFVAEVWARVFPAYWPIVKGLIKNEDLPAEQYTFGPFPGDQLFVQTSRLVRFRTRPHSDGLGTMGHFKANDDPIDGVAMLIGRNPDLLMLRVRLPREQRDLAPVIIRELLLRQRGHPR